METVVEEKPLSLATSRMVIIVLFISDRGPSLEIERLLADTTAESESSVKFVVSSLGLGFLHCNSFADCGRKEGSATPGGKYGDQVPRAF